MFNVPLPLIGDTIWGLWQLHEKCIFVQALHHGLDRLQPATRAGNVRVEPGLLLEWVEGPRTRPQQGAAHAAEPARCLWGVHGLLGEAHPGHPQRCGVFQYVLAGDPSPGPVLCLS